MEQNKLRDLTELADKRAQKEYEWVKHSMSMVAIVFGLIISLYHPDKDSSTIYFAIAIGINALCILCGLIFLYGETHTLHRLMKECIRIHESGKSDESSLIVVDRNKFFDTLKFAYFVLLFFSFLSISVYAINK